MRRKTKKIILISNFILIIAFAAVIFLFIYFSVTEPLIKSLISNKPLRFAVTFYGTENFMPDKLESYFVLFERENKILKVLSINTEAVVLKKKTKALSLKTSFFNTAKKDIRLALSNFYGDVFEMTDNSFVPDYYIYADFETLKHIAGNDESILPFLEMKDFENRDLECLHAFDFAENILNSFMEKTLSCVRKIRKNYEKIDTNIPKLAFCNMIMYFKFYEAGIMFFDFPVKYTKNRVEPDKDNIADMLYTQFYPVSDMRKTVPEGFVDVKNASGKARMAEKAAWKLRENKIDVLEWSTFKVHYKKTIIKNYKENYGAAKNTAEALGVGKIINAYNAKSPVSVGVFVGEDCEIYDKLDKKPKENTKA